MRANPQQGTLKKGTKNGTLRSGRVKKNDAFWKQTPNNIWKCHKLKRPFFGTFSAT